jgi:hypothetical protein
MMHGQQNIKLNNYVMIVQEDFNPLALRNAVYYQCGESHFTARIFWAYLHNLFNRTKCQKYFRHCHSSQDFFKKNLNLIKEKNLAVPTVRCGGSLAL